MKEDHIVTSKKGLTRGPGKRKLAGINKTSIGEGG